MSRFINVLLDGTPLPNKGKAVLLIQDGAKLIEQPDTISSNDIVCVVDNGAFEMAVHIYCDFELQLFGKPDGRSKIWLRYSKADLLADY